MAVALSALAASLVPLLLPWFGDGELALAGGRSSVWVLLPWIALAGLPRRSGGPPLAWCAAALLPLFALGLAADLRAGRAAGEVLRAALPALGLALLLAAAARRARGARLHALLWLALVPGAAALALVVELFEGPLPALGARATPLAWGARAAAGAPDVAPWAALAAALLLLAAAGRAEARGS